MVQSISVQDALTIYIYPFFLLLSPQIWRKQAQKLVLIDAQDYVDTVSVDTNVETVLTG